MSTTPVHRCHRFSVIASVVDTGDQLAPGPLIKGLWNVFGCAFSFQLKWYYQQPCQLQQLCASKTSAARNIAFWFKIFLAASGAFDQPLIRVCEVSMDSPFHGGSNITGGRKYCCLHMVASLFLPRSSQLFQKEQSSAVTTLAINFSQCRWYWSEITKNPKIYRRCQWHLRKLHWCQQHRR